jgi:hypothetical protein
MENSGSTSTHLPSACFLISVAGDRPCVGFLLQLRIVLTVMLFPFPVYDRTSTCADRPALEQEIGVGRGNTPLPTFERFT